MNYKKRIRWTKLGAAKSQLRTAIRLWFADGDQASIHTLASASHEIIHTLFKARGLKQLLFDIEIIPKDERQKWGSHIRKSANFLKHARHEIDGEFNFAPSINDTILLVCSVALQRMKEPQEVEFSAIIFWHLVHYPEALSNTSDSLVEGGVTLEALAGLRKIESHEFLEHFETAWAKGTRPRATFTGPGGTP